MIATLVGIGLLLVIASLFSLLREWGESKSGPYPHGDPYHAYYGQISKFMMLVGGIILILGVILS